MFEGDDKKSVPKTVEKARAEDRKVYSKAQAADSKLTQKISENGALAANELKDVNSSMKELIEAVKNQGLEMKKFNLNTNRSSFA